MSPIVVVPLVTVAVAMAVTAGLAIRVARAVTLLRAELAVLAQLSAARELLLGDLERTRRAFGRTGADVWPHGRHR